MKKIDEMFAIVYTPDGPDEETPDCEGVPALNLGGIAYPCVGADTARIEKLKQMIIENQFLDTKKLSIRVFKLVETTPFDEWEPK